ncbi:MAG: DNA (cytosine-5-)-methyltransferase [Pseudonocardia sp.]|nr:DNA (cytosine-5-)-methyltransferase [Pseudonocardia sp.]
MNVLSLFAGVGGLELGLERAGATTVGQVEIDPYCRQVLAKHWPEVPRHDDVRTAVEWWRSESRPRVDVVGGGFPCQPFSNAGFQLGIEDERWMWPDMAAVVRTVGPRYVVVENVSALVRDGRAFGEVLGDLHQFGFDAEWATVRASDFGAPHNRERVYLVAYPSCVDGLARDRLVTGGVRGASVTVGGFPGLAAHRGRRSSREWLAREPRVARLVDGVPCQVDRLRVLGNAVVPQVAEHIGRLIVAHDAALAAAA